MFLFVKQNQRNSMNSPITGFGTDKGIFLEPNKRSMGLDALLENQLGHLPKSHICSLSIPGVEIELIFTLRAAVSEIWANFTIEIFRHETWPLTKVPEVAHIPSFYPIALKLSLFSLHRQWFPRYRPIFKIAIFGHETWQLATVPEVAHIPSFYPRGSNFSLF